MTICLIVAASTIATPIPETTWGADETIVDDDDIRSVETPRYPQTIFESRSSPMDHPPLFNQVLVPDPNVRINYVPPTPEKVNRDGSDSQLYVFQEPQDRGQYSRHSSSVSNRSYSPNASGASGGSGTSGEFVSQQDSPSKSGSPQNLSRYRNLNIGSDMQLMGSDNTLGSFNLNTPMNVGTPRTPGGRLKLPGDGSRYGQVGDNIIPPVSDRRVKFKLGNKLVETGPKHPVSNLSTEENANNEADRFQGLEQLPSVRRKPGDVEWSNMNPRVMETEPPGQCILDGGMTKCQNMFSNIVQFFSPRASTGS